MFIEQPVPVRDGDVRGAGGREAGVQPALVHAAAVEDKWGRSDGWEGAEGHKLHQDKLKHPEALHVHIHTGQAGTAWTNF